MNNLDVIKHIVNAINSTEIHKEPFEHVYIQNIFPPEYYEQIFRNLLKSDAYYKPQVHTGHPSRFHGHYPSRTQLYVPEELQGAPTLDFFTNLKDILSSEEIFVALKEKFKEGFDKRFNRGESIEELRNMIKPVLLLAKHGKPHFLSQHTDIKTKVFTLIFNFPETDDKEYLGTKLYYHKDKDFECDGMTHHKPDNFILSHNVPFRKNSLLIFLRTNKSFHAVDLISDTETSERMNIQLNFSLPWGSDR